MDELEHLHLDAITQKLTREFDGLLPPSIITFSVRTAVSPGRAQARPEAVEETARTDSDALAQAVTRRGAKGLTDQ